MFDWKKKVDQHLEQERLRQEQEEQRRKERIEEQRNLQAAQDEKRRVALGHRFRCHVCGASAKTPGSVVKREFITYGGPSGDYAQTSYEYETDWSTPGDLKRCSKCNKWTCANDLHHDICKTCAEKL